ncbi:acyl-CoA dehydrogenase [Williamsia sp. 1138]|uniref:acyl-CoA dehydrogenase family protein n=1 Tax=Williamsia sp. 1138 TaxID=1903117 RepID=UPI000A11DEA5|nr:acyl-CoA dehydrogenase family protein [Williamsia sp. 1138]OZG28695.1 acyl-CoA dehydrogenase [Williamsia sp. 1138]
MDDREYRAALIDAANAIIERNLAATEVPVKDYDRRVWSEFTAAGFAALDVPENLGGSGGTLADALDIVTVAARRGALTPMIEHGVLAAWLAGQSRMALPGGICTVAIVNEAIVDVGDDGRLVLNGVIDAVPWAREAEAILLLVDSEQEPQRRLALVATGDSTVRVHPGTDLVGVPLNDITFNATVPETVATTETTAESLRRRSALAYTAAIAGASRQICDLTIGHARSRTQFGRPLAKFQAIQQRLAQLASVTASIENAARVATAEGTEARSIAAVASAAVAASTGAQQIGAAGHQIHGAIGFTSEYGLGRATTSLWSWRDRHVSADYWSDRLADEVLDEGAGVWNLITGYPRHEIDDSGVRV